MNRLTPVALILLFAPAPAQSFEVVVFGTYHAPEMFFSDDYTPAHIAAALERAQPDVVAVESHPTWFAAGRYHVVTYEAEGVAVPWARERELPVYGVDWKDVVVWDQGEELSSLREASGVGRIAGGALPTRWDLQLAASLPAEPVDFQHINSAEFGASRHPGRSKDDPDFAGPRDRGIAQHIVERMAAHPGKRLAVVIGANHKPFLDELLSRVEGVTVLQPGVDFPWPGEEEISAAWTADHLVTVISWRLDGRRTYGAPKDEAWLSGIERLLDRLEHDGSKPEIARYLRARWHAVAGRTGPSVELLGELLHRDTPDVELYPFPMRWWRMRYDLNEAVRLERARLALALDPESGRPLAELLLAPVEYAATRRLRDLERTRPRELRRHPVIRDASFEAGAEAASIFDGWADYIATGHGHIRWEGDEAEAQEGARALSLTVEKAGPYGFHVRQECKLPVTWSGGALEFECALRSEGLTRLSLSAHRAWSSDDRTPLSEAVLDPTIAGWQRARVEFEPPASGEFALYVKYDGPAGSRLWLDDGTPLVAEHMTRPREWSRAVLAQAFPAALLGPRDPFEAPGTPGQLADAGFEAGELSSSPMSGWYFDPADPALRITSDEELRTQGERSLRVSIEQPRNRMGGSPGLSQLVSGVAGPISFQLSLRADGPAVVKLDAVTWDDEKRARPLATRDVQLAKEEWTEAALDFEAPGGGRSVGLFVYLPGEVGRTIWLDDASLTKRSR